MLAFLIVAAEGGYAFIDALLDPILWASALLMAVVGRRLRWPWLLTILCAGLAAAIGSSLTALIQPGADPVILLLSFGPRLVVGLAAAGASFLVLRLSGHEA